MRGRIGAAVAVSLALLAATPTVTACVERVETTGASGSAPGNLTGATAPASASVVEQFAGEAFSFGVVPEAPVAAEGPPIRVGMINQENTPIGSFPELRLGAEAAVAFINAELGGVGGRPIELVPCITSFSVEQSQACAQRLVQQDVVAVLGGIDLASNGSIPVLEQNGMPYVGGIPINLDEMRSPISFQFSGGTPGAFVAFADHAAREGATRVVVAYGDYGPIRTAALDYGVATLKALGVPEVVEVPFPVTGTDFLPVLTKAAEGDPDAIFLGAADTACGPAMRTAHDLGIDATMYLVGACAAPAIAEQVGVDAVVGRIFNVEGPVSGTDREGELYFAAVARYGDPALPAASAATVSFRSTMNLYAVLAELGPDRAAPAAVTEVLRAARDRPSFDGHPYTCDGTQVPGLPALCSPQQILVERTAEGLAPITDWVDVPAVLRRVGG